MKTYVEPQDSGNILVTIAIGDTYLNEWEKNARPTWLDYCQRHGLGLLVFDQELIEKENFIWKKATWQKLLIGKTLQRHNLPYKNICYIDTDFLISPFAPNIFSNYNKDTIGLVSQIYDLPSPLHQTLRRLAFLRHMHWDKAYPLDSALFMPHKKIFEYHNLKPQDNYACAGLFLFNLENHSDMMERWFSKYDKHTPSITGGDEPFINFEIQNYGKISWLPYEFQALWIYEIAWRYPFLFDSKYSNTELVRECIEASLYSNHFLHFAGSWNESQMWKIGGFFETKNKKEIISEYKSYLNMKITGNPLGLVKPKC